MFSRFMPVIASTLLGAASLGVILASVPAHAATVLRPSAITEAEEKSEGGDDPTEHVRESDSARKKHAREKPDVVHSEAYERVHEPRERSERIEAARERRTGGR